jgi:hypothetical protein
MSDPATEASLRGILVIKMNRIMIAGNVSKCPYVPDRSAHSKELCSAIA